MERYRNHALDVVDGMRMYLSVLILALVTPLLGAPMRAVAAVPHLAVKHQVVAPGATQVVTLSGKAGGPLGDLAVTFPNGQTLSVAPIKGRRWSFVQPPNTLTHSSRTATLSVSQGPSGPTLSARYTVGFGQIDLVVPIAPVRAYSTIFLWIHASGGSQVNVVLTEEGAAQQVVRGQTGIRGWLQVPFHADGPLLGPSTVRVVASVLKRGQSVVTSASFVVAQFDFQVWLAGQHVYHLEGGAWVPTDTVSLGETVRIGGPAVIVEPAGTMPSCVHGTVEIRQGDRTLFILPITCEYEASIGPISYAETRFTDPQEAGPLTAVIHVTWVNAAMDYTVPFTLAS